MSGSRAWTSWFRGAAVVVVAIGLAVGCGGDGSGTDACGDCASTAPVQGPAGPPSTAGTAAEAGRVQFEFCGA